MGGGEAVQDGRGEKYRGEGEKQERNNRDRRRGSKAEFWRWGNREIGGGVKGGVSTWANDGLGGGGVEIPKFLFLSFYFFFRRVGGYVG